MKLPIAIGLGLVTLAGCVGPEIEALRGLEPGGDSFSRELSEEYRAFALFEADEMYDWIDAGYFARKALLAARGAPVEAERLEVWDLPAARVAELADARVRLLDAFDRGARERHPTLAARAQGAFDCWVEQQEENHQPEDIARCRDGLHAALGEIEQRLAVAAPPLVPAAPPDAEEPLQSEPTDPRRVLSVLFFRIGGAELSDRARQDLRKVAEESAGGQLVLIGHSDRAGPAAANLDLSLRRARAVGEVLIAEGVDPARIHIEGRGESDPAVVTPDGTVLQANRRVEVLLVESRNLSSARPRTVATGIYRCAGTRTADTGACPSGDQPGRSHGRGGLAHPPALSARRRARRHARRWVPGRGNGVRAKRKRPE